MPRHLPQEASPQIASPRTNHFQSEPVLRTSQPNQFQQSDGEPSLSLPLRFICAVMAAATAAAAATTAAMSDLDAKGESFLNTELAGLMDRARKQGFYLDPCRECEDLVFSANGYCTNCSPKEWTCDQCMNAFKNGEKPQIKTYAKNQNAMTVCSDCRQKEANVQRKAKKRK